MQHDKKISSRKPSLRGAALGLVFLIAHAVVVGLAHHHAAVSTRSGDFGLAISNSEAADQSPLSGGDSQCLSCSLQRNIVSEVRPASVLIEMVLHSAQVGSAERTTASKGTILVFSNRAPPPA